MKMKMEFEVDTFLCTFLGGKKIMFHIPSVSNFLTRDAVATVNLSLDEVPTAWFKWNEETKSWDDFRITMDIAGNVEFPNPVMLREVFDMKSFEYHDENWFDKNCNPNFGNVKSNTYNPNYKGYNGRK